MVKTSKIFLIAGCIFNAIFGLKNRIRIPISSGNKTRIKRGLAIAQALTLNPSARYGIAKGRYKTIKADTSSMNAAVSPRFPLALSTIIGRNGAHGVVPSKIMPIA